MVERTTTTSAAARRAGRCWRGPGLSAVSRTAAVARREAADRFAHRLLLEVESLPVRLMLLPALHQTRSYPRLGVSQQQRWCHLWRNQGPVLLPLSVAVLGMAWRSRRAALGQARLPVHGCFRSYYQHRVVCDAHWHERITIDHRSRDSRRSPAFGIPAGGENRELPPLSRLSKPPPA